VIYLNLSARGPIIALDFPKLVPNSMNVILFGEFRSILKTTTCSALSSSFNFDKRFLEPSSNEIRGLLKIYSTILCLYFPFSF